MNIKAETDLKDVLKEEVTLVESIYGSFINMKVKLEEKNEIALKQIVSEIETKFGKFRDLETKRDEIFKEFVGDKEFSSTYEAIEILSEVYKEEIYNYLHKLKIGVMNIRNVNYLIENYVDTSLDVLDLIFQGIQESTDNATYKNPYAPKGASKSEASILVNKKL